VATTVGLVGLPNAGKSTLLNALTRAGAEVGNFPFTTVDCNHGICPVPDDRLAQVAALTGSRRLTPATVEFVDIAGLVRGACRGEGLGNQFLGHIRQVDAVVHVVRCFQDPAVSHVEGAVDPVRDVETVNLELALADLQTLDNRRERLRPAARSGDREAREELGLLDELTDAIGSGRSPRTAGLPDPVQRLAAQLFLLTFKPAIYAANVDEDSTEDDPAHRALADWAREQGSPVVRLSAGIEAELAELDPAERAEFAAGLEVDTGSLSKLVVECQKVLDQITFFTINENESRAWAIQRGTTARQAAGKVHSDMERGFIAAEVVPARSLIAAGSYGEARRRGLVRLEGRDYPVRDGDVVLFRFNV